jgi:hypothetical protein
MDSDYKAIAANTLFALKHDIKNQLTNITLILNQLRYELPDATPDCVDYLEMIEASARKIDSLLNEAE